MTSPTPSATASELLGFARQVTSNPETQLGRAWPRIAAFLARTALERAVTACWTDDLTQMTWAPISTQLLCLHTQVIQPDLARDVYVTWINLSQACHAHPYELPPTVEELHRWIGTVEWFVGHLRAPK